MVWDATNIRPLLMIIDIYALFVALNLGSRLE